MKQNKEIQAVRAELFKSSFALQQTAVLQAANVHKAAQMIHQALRSGGKLLICGNGGSAADSQHMAAELVVRFQKERRPLAALALTTDSSLLTAEGNDHGFGTVFSRQVEALGKKGDVLLVISTSGNSDNVLKAAQAARKKGLRIIGLSGGTGGKLKKACHLCLLVPGDVTCRIQECHLAMEHAICDLVEDWLGKK
jgi:D-sedoheptulose 7-phosphate isomerase